MRPTGRLHIGHLAGALDNWIRLQDEYECFFMVADWHAFMSEYEKPSEINKYALDNAGDWIACGISPEKAVIFVQSAVSEHLELYMSLSCLTPLGWLERNPTYKEQLREVKTRDLNTLGFLSYPVLQAADILIYGASAVPVGEDQLPHLELTREIARRFNSLYNTDLLIEPEGLLTLTPRLLGIDGRKMSKSFGNTINLSDAPDEVRRKTRSMFTDPKRVKFTDPGHPDECNVCSYYAYFKPEMKAEVFDWCSNSKIGCTECKSRLAEVILQVLRPIHERRSRITSQNIHEVLKAGEQKAKQAASDMRKRVKEAAGV